MAITIAALLGGGLAAEEPGEASETSSYQPPVYRAEAIPLLEAIRITLEHEPNIRLQVEEELYRAGRAREATGLFDSTVLGSIDYEHTEEELSQASRLVQDSDEGTLDLRLQKQFRSGPVVQPFVTVAGSSIELSAEADDPSLEGTLSYDQYSSAVGFAVDIPLARGRGVASTGAPERAATTEYDATVATTTHTASSAVLATANSYWSLLAAQRNLQVAERSLKLNQRLLDLSREMVNADELPRVELARTQARLAEARAQVESAKSTLHQARLDFVTTVGLAAPDESSAPLAADDFPPIPTPEQLAAIDVGGLTVYAFSNRKDLEAAQLSEESGRILYRAAQLDLKVRTDLSAELSWTGRELTSSLSEGLEETLFGDYTGPSGKLGLTVEWPLQNNVQRGRLEQQRALYNQNAITTRDLARTIQSNIAVDIATLREAAQQVRQYTEAVDYYRESLDSEIEKFRIGVSTLVDAIFTEQNQIAAELGLISSLQQYAQLLAQLRYESATLLEEGDEGWMVTAANVLTLPIPGDR
jgi:outer membrane protein TolC